MLNLPPSKLPHVGLTIFTQISQLAQQTGAINLSQGFPDFDSPAPLLELLKKYANQGFQQYAPMMGLPNLREQVAFNIQQRYGFMPDSEQEVIITSGATAGIFCAIQALVGQGDEVIIFDPCYDSYDPAVRLAGGECVHLPLAQPDFNIDWQLLADRINPKTRLLIINFPHNPSGAILSKDDLEQLYKLIQDKNIFILSDEVYEYLVFDQHRHASVLSHAGLRARAFMVGSFGKTFHVTGWKTGYVYAPKYLMQEFIKVHQYVNFCGVTPIQYALAKFMQQYPQHIQGLAEFYQQKRDYFNRGLASTRFRFVPTQGTYFQLVDYSAIQPNLTDIDMVHWLIKQAGVAAIPISVFYEKPEPDQRLIRLCFAKQKTTLDAAIARLQQL